MHYFWIIISYFLGSVPFGYLISRFSGKNVLEIGWRKTSGSNVFKNVGKLQGILTGFLDVAKGFLAVYAAQKMGFSAEIQLLSGAAAVAGHNWSVFLRFAGGRGIATFVGAFLALSPQILFLSIAPLFVLALVWNAAIGTILFLIAAGFFSFYLNQFEIAGNFTIISFILILIKRLSPAKEIAKSKNKAKLIFNRLVFDDDFSGLSLRIKRIIQKEKNNPSRIVKTAMPLAKPFLVPPKLGWKAAKYGAKMAGKPIRFILNSQEKVVTEISIEEFKKMMISASKKIVLHQEEINRINVFPVADKDTGYNLAATLLGVEGAISPKNYSTFRELTQDIKEAAMINARGNAGMIYTGYVIEVLERIKHLESIDAFHLALAMKRGIKAARLSVVEPVEGTVLDVIKTAGNKTFELAKSKKEKNIIKILEQAHKESLVTLKETKEKLPVLKENDVIDAGALGFVKILEAWIESLKGFSIAANTEFLEPVFSQEAQEELEYRYEAVFSFKKKTENNIEELKKELSLFGGSLEILELEDMVKVHIHTNNPEAVQDKFKNMPEFELKIEDMKVQIEKVKEKTAAENKINLSQISSRQKLGLIVDEVADLPKEFLGKYNIAQVPFAAKFPQNEIAFSKGEFYQKLQETIKSGKFLPTTSAPSFKDFFAVYQKAFKSFEKIFVITLSSKFSGAYSSARIARSIYKKPEKLNVFVFDCFTAGAGEGLAAIKAQELISQGKETEEITEDLKKLCPKIIVLGYINDFKYIVRGGRLKFPAFLAKPAYLIQKLGVRIIFGLKNGKIKMFKVKLNRDVFRILSEEINKQRKGKKIKAAIVHADNYKEAEKLKKELESNSMAEVLFVSLASLAVASHVGPGALLVSFYVIDE